MLSRPYTDSEKEAAVKALDPQSCPAPVDSSITGKSSEPLDPINCSAGLTARQRLDMTPGQRLHSAAVKIHSVVKFTRMQRLQRRARWLTKKLIVFILSHVGLTSLVGLYAVAGGFIFSSLESGVHQGIVVKSLVKTNLNLDQLRSQLLEAIWNTTMELNVLKQQEWTREAMKQLNQYDTRVHEAYVQSTNESCEQKRIQTEEATRHLDNEWTYPRALLFAVTVITTIGYGDKVPRTINGKVVCMIYALVGIPLTLLCLANIGSLLATVYRFSWKNLCRLGRILVKDPNRHLKTVTTCQVRVPVLVCLITMVVYILCGAVIFWQWEGWDFLDSCYFCFVTLSTIGFGDFVPGQVTHKDTLDSNYKQVVCALYLLFGLSLLSMIFQLIQDSVVVVVGRYASFLGLSKSQIEKDIEDFAVVDERTPSPMTADKHVLDEASVLADGRLEGADDDKNATRKAETQRSSQAEQKCRQFIRYARKDSNPALRQLLSETGDSTGHSYDK